MTDAIRDRREGLPGAGDRLWELVYPWFYRLAQVLLAHDRQRWQVTPEDLLHDAFRKVGLSYLREPGVNRARLRDWMLRSMREILIDRARWAAVRQRRPAEVATCTETVESGLKPWERADLGDRLSRLQQCDVRAFHVLEMWVFGHKSLAEIAALAGHSPSNAGKLLEAAFVRMRKMDG